MANVQQVPSPYKERQQAIIYAVALAAERRPLLASGLWFHDDVRNNFYYASYLFAAAVDPVAELPFDREGARLKAEAVLLETVLLQNRQPGTELYGHWPLGLDPEPRAAKPHELPVEIMGGLMAYFCRKYGKLMSGGLRLAFHTAMGHIYRSGFFRKPVITFGHHEAKYTAAKLIFGRMFEDEELIEDGRGSLRDTLAYIRSAGMPEYGSLPWFWHWVQAFTCAFELTPLEDTEQRGELSAMLDYLWEQRAESYLQGAWVGAHSRGWPHDIPQDRNLLHDFVQFGDFELTEDMPRTEYAGFLFYEAPEQARSAALNRRTPVEIKKMTAKVVPGVPQPKLHSYAYITEEYAAGGLWERVEEFDNEQLRWAYTLPLSGRAGANRLYFFHPGHGYREGDPRHQSPYMEVLYHQNVVMAVFPVPTGEVDRIYGVLPKGEWLNRERCLFGQTGEVYFAVYLPHAYQLTERPDYIEVTVDGMPGGVVVEAVSVKQAVSQGMHRLEQFAELMSSRPPVFHTGASLSATYITLTSGEDLQLHSSGQEAAQARALLDGKEISLNDYRV
ncbi:hypothetical protein GCM10010912_25730 [Paenibacillus albidus]|uniref:Uncharacterized protein n=1 Tax=Paenibacillus albidus TaxID=2041023 RepID=A0A917CAJ2_9BACL|nr:hypothetical protein [Paenibacillus albidus]GGF79587.1 hypothetical protein GCM10010912_25730 [Paenibacillus albidus]